MNQESNKNKSGDETSALVALATLEAVVRKMGSEADGLVAPVRQTIFKRYPTLFIFLTTLGATAVFLSLEKILLQVSIFEERPGVLFIIGIVILASMGRLYKKLG